MIEEHQGPLPRIRAFTPARRTGDRPARRFRRGVYLLPSMFTIGNMFCGYACVVYAMRGDLVTAAPTRDREAEAAKARARAEKRFGRAAA